MLESFQARIVFPVVSPPVEHGVVTIDGGRVVEVGTSVTSGRAHDLGDVALLPGLVNAHTHLEFSDLQKPLGQPGMPFADWIRAVIAERQRGDRTASQSVAAGVKESLAGGVTAIGEIATAEAAAYASALPIDLTLLMEVIGFSAVRATSALAAATERLDALQAAAYAEGIQLGISPHAPYSVSPQLLDGLIALARRRGLPIAMHLAESAEELEFLATGQGPLKELLEERSMWEPSTVPRGSRPFDYLRRLAEAPRAIVVHGNYLDDEARAFLAAHAARMALVYCPRTHAYFGRPPYPLAKALAAGVRVALGTDSRASNPDLNMLAEMRHVARVHPHIEPETILRMATLSGSEALGRSDEFGNLAPGKWANLVAVPLPRGARDTPRDLLAALLHADETPSGTWLRGQQVYGQTF